MFRNPRSIRSILFYTYTAIIVIGISILFVLFYLWSSGLLKTKAFNSISELSASLQTQLDLEVQKLDSVSVSILYSNLITDRISTYNTPEREQAAPPATGLGYGHSNNPNSDLYDILVALVGPAYPVEQVYLHLLSGTSIGVGFDNSQSRMELASQPWYPAITRNKKVLMITGSSNGSSSQYSLSLFRYFFDKYNNPLGIVEVKQSYNKIFKSIMQQSDNNPSLDQVVIYSDSGEIMYPYEVGEHVRKVVRHIMSNPSDSYSSDEGGYIHDPETKEKILLNIKYSDLTGWNIAVMVSSKTLLSPLNRFTSLAIIVTLIILSLQIILSYLASKRITRPLSSLNKAIKSMSLETLAANSSVELHSGLNEWDRLNISFMKMNTRLKESLDQLLLARTQELQARLTALQSQMNPHFLYNSLATISAMAYEQMSDEIIIMCDNLSDMMRYIAADDSSLVELQTEIGYTEMYLTCMKLRYGEMLTCTIELDTSLQKICIPKIMIQPLVENALKYGTTTSPPWRISVNGRIADNRWFIEVTDNGPGFNEQELSRFYAQVEDMAHNNALPALKLHGMGLLNVYIRLKLHYGSLMIFEIGNLPGRGARVTIGGPV